MRAGCMPSNTSAAAGPGQPSSAADIVWDAISVLSLSRSSGSKDTPQRRSEWAEWRSQAGGLQPRTRRCCPGGRAAPRSAATAALPVATDASASAAPATPLERARSSSMVAAMAPAAQSAAALSACTRHCQLSVSRFEIYARCIRSQRRQHEPLHRGVAEGAATR